MVWLLGNQKLFLKLKSFHPCLDDISENASDFKMNLVGK